MNRGTLYLLIPVIFWGLSYIAIKIVLGELEPVEMISIRFLLAVPALLGILLFKKINIFPLKNHFEILVGALLIFVHFWVMAVGMQETTASNTAWILTTAPIFIAILGWIVLKEKFTLRQSIGLMVAAFGVIVLMANGSFENLKWLNSRGDYIVLGSCVTWATYTIWIRKIRAVADPLYTTFWMTTFAGLIFVPYTFFTSDVSKFMTLQTDTLVSLIFLGVFCLAIAFWLWSEGLARQNASEVGIYLYVEPLITMVGAWVILSEQITAWLILGAIFITVGVFIAEKSGKTKLMEHDA